MNKMSIKDFPGISKIIWVPILVLIYGYENAINIYDTDEDTFGVITASVLVVVILIFAIAAVVKWALSKS